MLTDMIGASDTVDFGPPLTPWERSDEALSDRFREEFPDGVVPIRHVPKMGTRTSDPVEWAHELVKTYDAAKRSVRSVDDCARTREEFLDTYGGHWDDTSCIQARRAAVRRLCYEGLSMRQVARYLHRDAAVIVRLIYQINEHEPIDPTVLVLDDVVVAWMQGGREGTMADLARRYGVGPKVVRRLVHLHDHGTLSRTRRGFA